MCTFKGEGHNFLDPIWGRVRIVEPTSSKGRVTIFYTPIWKRVRIFEPTSSNI